MKMYSKCKSQIKSFGDFKCFLVHFFVSIQLHDIRFTKCNISCWIYSSKNRGDVYFVL